MSALVVFVLAAVTDGLDGYFARRLNQSTALGRQLDPLVDKVIVCGAFIYLLTAPGDTGLAPWMSDDDRRPRAPDPGVAEVTSKAAAWRSGRRWPASSRRSPSASRSRRSSSSSAWVSTSRGLLMTRDTFTWLAVGLTIYSGLGYFALAIPTLRGRPDVPLIETDSRSWTGSNPSCSAWSRGSPNSCPISSDGHLKVTQSIFAKILNGKGRSAAEEIFFDVMLHVGTLLAIILHYRGERERGGPVVSWQVRRKSSLQYRRPGDHPRRDPRGRGDAPADPGQAVSS